jgi:hypothetical protein
VFFDRRRLVQPKLEPADVKPEPTSMDTWTPSAAEEDRKPPPLVDWLVELEPELCGERRRHLPPLLFWLLAI